MDRREKERRVEVAESIGAPISRGVGLSEFAENACCRAARLARRAKVGLVHHRSDPAGNKQPNIVEVNRYHGLNVQHILHAAEAPDREVHIVLKWHADEVSYRILEGRQDLAIIRCSLRWQQAGACQRQPCEMLSVLLLIVHWEFHVAHEFGVSEGQMSY